VEDKDQLVLKKRAWQEVDRLWDRLIEISQAIHARPEVGGEEVFASNLLADELVAFGFEVEKEYFGIPTAFHATLAGKKEGAAVAFIAEYDALPEIGHGCGHNIIGAAAVGAALALVPLVGEIDGSIHVYGTPAEETNGAKVPLSAGGAFEGIDAAMMIHPSGRTVLMAPSLAMDAIEFSFRGQAAHAAASPQEGINALDAVILTFNAINALREHVSSDVRIHGIISNGGVVPNIVPEEAVARFYVRADTRRHLNQVLTKVINCARGAAMATGAELTVSNFEYSFDEIRTNLTLAQAMLANLVALDEDVVMSGKGVGSLDMGNVSQVVPSIHPYVAIGSPSLVCHTREFTQAAGGSDGMRAVIIGAKALAATALDVLTRADLREALWKEFRQEPWV
jgi:amidohydrolase